MDSRTGRSALRTCAAAPPQPEPPHPPLFNGPVRKWRKQWVNCGVGVGRNAGKLRLYQWRPLSAEEAAAEETRERRFRYHPIVSLKETNTGAPGMVSVEGEASAEKLANGSTENGIAMDDASKKLSDGEIPVEKPAEDETDANIAQDNGSYSGAPGTNPFTWTTKMLIDWEDELMS